MGGSVEYKWTAVFDEIQKVHRELRDQTVRKESFDVIFITRQYLERLHGTLDMLSKRALQDEPAPADMSDTLTAAAREMDRKALAAGVPGYVRPALDRKTGRVTYTYDTGRHLATFTSPEQVIECFRLGKETHGKAVPDYLDGNAVMVERIAGR